MHLPIAATRVLIPQTLAWRRFREPPERRRDVAVFVVLYNAFSDLRITAVIALFLADRRFEFVQRCNQW